MAQQIERIPPHNHDAEVSVLGSSMMEEGLFYNIAEILTADDFYENAHKEIFKAMYTLASENKPIDLLTVTEQLSRDKKIEFVGGRAYIAELTSLTVTTANAMEYAKIVQEKSLHRKLLSACKQIADRSYNEEEDARVLLDNAEESILKIAPENKESDYADLKDILKQNISDMIEASKNELQTVGLSTGLISLDKVTNGLKKSNLIIIAARPSVGKTAFALNLAQFAAVKKKKRVVIFSLEQDRLELGQRLLAMQARVDSRKIQIGDLNQEEWEDINRAVAELTDAQIIIDDTSKTAMAIRNKCRRFAAEGPIDLVLIDYIQLMNQDQHYDNRAVAVAQDSKYLKQLAKELKVPVIALAQLNKESAKRDNKGAGAHRPMMSEIKDSDAIAADADVIMLLHREDYYKTDPNQPNSNECEVIVAKNRNGETGSVVLTWLPRFTKFVDKAPSSMLPPQAV